MLFVDTMSNNKEVFPLNRQFPKEKKSTKPANQWEKAMQQLILPIFTRLVDPYEIILGMSFTQLTDLT